MGRYIARRFPQGLVVIFGVTVFVFVVTRMVGDPVKFMLPLSATRSSATHVAPRSGSTSPILEQFVDFLGDVRPPRPRDEHLVRGQPALDVVFDYLPTTLSWSASGWCIAVVLSIPLGVLASRKPGGTARPDAHDAQPDRPVDAAVLPRLRAADPLHRQVALVPDRPGPWTATSILPAICLALPAIGRLTMVVRSSMIDELNTQYVKVAQGQGHAARRRILGVHALRNAGIPYVTLLGWEIIRALAGYTVVVEAVFNWPGLGFMANDRDRATRTSS